MFYCLHVIALMFMTPQPILGHFLPIFYGFSSKLLEIAKFSLKIVIFCHFEYLPTFLVQNSVQGATFNFLPILADFHEYTLNMTSYHLTEAPLWLQELHFTRCETHIGFLGKKTNSTSSFGTLSMQRQYMCILFPEPVMKYCSKQCFGLRLTYFYHFLS